MNWNEDKSISLSQICVCAFALLLAGLDGFGYWLLQLFAQMKGREPGWGLAFYIALLLGSVFGWVALGKLWGLLKSIQAGQVFTAENIRRMRVVSWCCAAAGLVCLGAGLLYLPCLVCAMAAGFMALIVRIVKNTFQQAMLMKDELDYTV